MCEETITEYPCFIKGVVGNVGVTGRCDPFERVSAGANCSATNCRPIENIGECHAAVAELLPSDMNGLAREINTSRAPQGCSVVSVHGGAYHEGVFNAAFDVASASTCSDFECLCRCPQSVECKIISSSALTIATDLSWKDDPKMQVCVCVCVCSRSRRVKLRQAHPYNIAGAIGCARPHSTCSRF